MENKVFDGSPSRAMKWIYIVLLVMLVFSGFGQMPIFKRYYLADLPGMAWAADYFITLNMHYIAAALFLALSAYFLITRAMTKTLTPIGGRGLVRGILFLVLTLTGIVLVLRNLPDLVLPPGLIVASTLGHVAGTMLFIVAAVTYFRFGKKSK